MTTEMEATEIFSLERGGNRDLKFTGQLLGVGRASNGYTVEIYRTAGGLYPIRAVWPPVRGETGRRSTVITVCGAENLLAALRDEWGGYAPAELEAWKEACKIDPALAAICAEEIE